MLSTIPSLYLQFLAWRHPHILFQLFYSFSPSRKHLHNTEGSLALHMVLSSFHTTITYGSDIAHAYAYALYTLRSISEITHARSRTRDTLNGR